MKAIAVALLKVQAELEPVKKAKQGHNYKYADLAAVMSECMETLNKQGVLLVQAPYPAADGVAGIETRLIHAETGEEISSRIEVPCKAAHDPQAYGAAITYAKRYALVSMLGIATEDDDARTAMPQRRPARAEVPKASPRPTAAEWFTSFRSQLAQATDRGSFIEEHAAGLERLTPNEAYGEDARALLAEVGREAQ